MYYLQIEPWGVSLWEGNILSKIPGRQIGAHVGFEPYLFSFFTEPT